MQCEGERSVPLAGAPAGRVAWATGSEELIVCAASSPREDEQQSFSQP